MGDITFIEPPYSMQEGSGAPSRSLEWADHQWYPSPQSPAAERQVFQVGLDEPDGLSGFADLLGSNWPLIAALVLGGWWLLSRGSSSGSGLKGLGDGGLGGSRRYRAPRQEVTLESPVGELSLYLRTDR